MFNRNTERNFVVKEGRERHVQKRKEEGEEKWKRERGRESGRERERGREREERDGVKRRLEKVRPFSSLPLSLSVLQDTLSLSLSLSPIQNKKQNKIISLYLAALRFFACCFFFFEVIFSLAAATRRPTLLRISGSTLTLNTD